MGLPQAFGDGYAFHPDRFQTPTTWEVVPPGEILSNVERWIRLYHAEGGILEIPVENACYSLPENQEETDG